MIYDGDMMATRKNRWVVLAAALALGLAAIAWTTHVSPAPEWDAVFARSSGWVGGDVAASMVLPGHRALWVFGDSFIGEVEDGRRKPRAMVNNSIAVHPVDPANPSRPPASDELKFYWGPDDEAGKPTAWVRPDDPDQWFWPTGGGAVVPGPAGERLALFLVEMSKTGETVWSFKCVGSAVAVVEGVAGPVESWRKEVRALPHRIGDSGREVDWGVDAVYEPGPVRNRWVYIYATVTDDDKRRDLIVARVRPEGIEDFNAWQFRAGLGWMEEPEQARTVSAEVSSELSVDRVETVLGPRYVMVMSEPGLGRGIEVRWSCSPSGPWSKEQMVYRVTGLAEGQFVYAGKAHAALSSPGALLISYVVNSNNFFEMAGNAEIYRPRFIVAQASRPAKIKPVIALW